MKLKTPNALNLFGIRRVEKAPQHFEYLTVPITYNTDASIAKWIETHMKHRFYIGRTLDIDSEDRVVPFLRIGFEEPKELSYFTLACPHLKYK